MSFTAYILIFLSASLHAVWNLLSKANRPTPLFFFLTALFNLIFLLPVAIIDYQGVRAIFQSMWPFLIATGFFQGLYYTSLAYSYQKNDMTLAYPLIRGIPVVIIPLISGIFKLGDPITSMAFLGLFLIFFGCLMIPIKTFLTWRIKDYFHLRLLWIIPAALGTVGYTSVDGFTINSINSSTLTLPVSLVYGALLHMAIVPWMAIFTTATGDWKNLQKFIGKKLLAPLFTAIGVGSAYILVLASMKYVTNISYVAGFRQLSIPIGVLLGIMLLKEKVSLPRMLGTILLTMGLVFTGIY